MAEQVSQYLQKARSKLESHKNKPLSLEAKEKEVIELAHLLLQEAKRIQTRKEKKRQERLSRIMKDPRGRAFTMMFLDECFRSRKTKRNADQLMYLIEQFGIPRSLELGKRLQLALFKKIGRAFHFLLIPLIRRTLRKMTTPKKPEEGIESSSIHISTLYSQCNELEWEKTMGILSDRLRPLYREAKPQKKILYLNMAEYRDLHLTKELFKRVLSEEEFLDYSGGILLQAYLPDSYPIMRELTEWAIQRKARGGAPVMIRVVKGSNLKKEQVDASIHNWPQAPYKTKGEVDANYKRMILYGCQSEHAEAVHIGIASHNPFDIAFAMLTSVENNVENHITFEMLQGIADPIARVVKDLAGEVFLYCPTVTKKDFQSFLAHLIRKLGEIEDRAEQEKAFSVACSQINSVSETPRRTQSRFDPPRHLEIEAPFAHEPETDFSLPQNQKWGVELIQNWEEKKLEDIPLVIDGNEIHRDQKGEGIEPSHPHETLYQYSLATWEDIDQALHGAKTAESEWGNKSARERCEILADVAEKMREKRADLIGVLMKDVGKSIFEADREVSQAIDFAEYYLRNLLEFDRMKEIRFSSLGTLLIASPSNFPISIPSSGLAAGLITGNCILFKPAPEAVLAGWILVNLFWEAGIPKNVLQFVNCVDDPIGSQLIQDERINGIILTGETSTARLFMKMRPDLFLSAQLGGKNALIITGMADRDLAIKDLIQSAFSFSGQKCSAASLAILEAEVYDDKHFMRKLKDAVESLPIAPLIHAPNDALKKGLTTLDRGEKWLVEPKPDPNNPQLWSPGVKLGVKEGSFMHETELFGPILGIMRAKNLTEALHLANRTLYGLTSGIHSLDRRETNAWIKRIEAGNCYVNRPITGTFVERQPFGGCKASIFGPGFKVGGPHYITQFMHKKQLEIPKEKAPIPDSLNTLTRFLTHLDLSSEELGLWFASTSNYAHWAKFFTHDQDPQKVVGQDNLLRFVPHERMALRIQKEDPPLDILRVIAAALACKCHLEITYDPTALPIQIENEWKQALQGISFTEETEEDFIARIQWGSFTRLRFIQKPSKEVFAAASESATCLHFEPVLASGRLELLHYLREVTLSTNYHRYGNLGTREGEARSEIL